MLLASVKRLLGLKLDEEEDDVDCFEEYKAALNSSKYADSQSDTKHIERLLALVGVDKDKTATSLDQKKDKSLLEEPLTNKVAAPDGSDWDKQNEDTNQEEDEVEDEGEILPGQPTYKPAKFGKKGGTNFVLRKFDAPRWVSQAIKHNNVGMLHLNSQLTFDNYVQRFQTLLWVEEVQQANEMRKYDMYSVLLAKFEDFFLLDVPGLAEGRPSLLRGDRLLLRSNQRSSYYEGYIHDVREHDILFKLHENLHSTAMDGLRFNVSFVSSRTPFRRCHHGVFQFRERPTVRHMIFPTASPISGTSAELPMIRVREQNEESLKCFNEKLNPFQRRAITNVLRGKSRPAPYIMFGPPGTGKTVTLVEAVLQVYSRARHFKILVCANSNSSTDLCAKRIQDSGVVPKDQLLRLSAFYRMEKLIPQELEAITKCMEGLDAYTYAECRIVITTCIHSGSLYEFEDRFDYVFIDEAGHASEPEALVPMGLLNANGCCVLAGDPHQLGPICISRVADQYGLGTSLLERLCRRSIYQRNSLNKQNKMDYNERYITKLRICYRCDARVLSISNKFFYDNDLKFVNETPKYWLDVLNLDWPLVFHCVKGRDRREFTNPSWFNPSESIRCLSYAKRLYDSGLRPDQLGIITPYRRQIDKLNLLFESCNLAKCKIATMEEFQGDEREIIIISTVRTRERKLEFDQKFQLGFLFNPKRFNVAISRAKWLVIVVGDSRILSRDTYWQHYMDSAFAFIDPQDAPTATSSRRGGAQANQSLSCGEQNSNAH